MVLNNFGFSKYPNLRFTSVRLPFLPRMRNCRLNMAIGRRSDAGPEELPRSSRGAPGRPTADRGPEGSSGALVGSVGHSLTRRIKFSTPEAPESFPDPFLGPPNFHMGRNWAYEQRIGSILCGKSTEKIGESSRGHQSGQEEAWTPQFGG